MKKNLLILLISILSFSAYSQAGSNDNTFNTIDIGFGNGDGPNNKVMCSAQQSDGKIIIGGAFTTYNGIPSNCIARLNVDGSLDTSFNVGTGANNMVKTVAIQSDGKILIGGSFTTYNGDNSQHIVRLNIDGTKDTTFVSGPGTIDNDINVIAITPDGNIAIGGKFTQYLGYGLRYFAFLYADGSVNGPAIAARADNEINAIAVQSNGKIVVGGAFTQVQNVSRNKIARLNADGSLDATFVPAGTGSNIGANNTINTVALQPDGKIIIGGYFTSYAGMSANKITRLNSNGTKDLSFNPGSGVQYDDGLGNTDSTETAIFSIVIKSNGNLLIGGNFNKYNGSNCWNFVQLYSDGSKEQSYCFSGTSFNIIGQSSTPNSTTFVEAVRTILFQNDGKTIIAGNFGSLYFHNYIARFNEGTEDLSFNTGTGASFSNNGNSTLTNLQAKITDIAIQSDNKSIITGKFRYYNGVVANTIARLNPDGSADTSFNTSSLNVVYNTSQYNKIALQSDGKVLLFSYPNLIRLNSNGSLDTSFNSTVTYTINGVNYGNLKIYDIKVLPNGKILICGVFNQVNGITRTCIARLNGDGSLDNSFNLTNNNGYTVINNNNFRLNTISLLSNGNIIIGGYSPVPSDAVNATNVFLLDQNGLILNGYGNLGITPFVNSSINGIGIQSGGKAIIVGDFTKPLYCTPQEALQNNIRIFRDNYFTGLFSGSSSVFHRGGTDGKISKVLIQCDDKIIILGDFTTFDGVSRNGIARLNEDGTLDTTFNVGTGASTINAIAQQNDGKLIIGGAFASYNGIGRNRVARLNNDIINVYPAQTTGTITGATLICRGTTLTYSVPAITNADSYEWTLPSGGVIINNNGNSIDVYFGLLFNSGSITVKGVNACGSSNIITLPVSIYTPILNTISITGTIGVCKGSSYTYTVPADSNVSSYQWTLPLGATGTSTTNSITVTYTNNAVSGNILVKRFNVCGSSTDTTISITVGGMPANAGVISGSTTVCRNQSFTYTVPSITGAAIYNWTYSSGLSGPATTSTNSVSVLISSTFTSGSVTVSGGNGCGINGMSSSIQLNANIVTAPVTSNQNFCSSNNPTINDMVASGTDLKWYYSTNSTSLASNTSLVNNHYYYVTQTINGCESDFNVSLVTIIQPPSPPSNILLQACNCYSFCNGDPVYYLTNQLNGWVGTNHCYSTLNGGVELDPNTPLVDGMVYYISAGETCESLRSPTPIVTVTTTPPPVGNTVQPYVSGQTLANLQITGSNLIWYDSNNNQISNTTFLTNGTTYYVTQTVNYNYGSCTSIPLSVTVTSELSSEIFQKNKFTYYPNPVNDILIFENNNLISKITLFNIIGQLVAEKEINSLTGQLDMSKLPSGNYLLKVKTENEESNIKLVKK